MCQLLFRGFHGQCNLHSRAQWAGGGGGGGGRKMFGCSESSDIIAAESVTADSV